MKKYATLITFKTISNNDHVKFFETLLKDIQLEIVSLNEFNSIKVYCNESNIDEFMGLIANCNAGIWGNNTKLLMKSCSIYGPYEMI